MWTNGGIIISDNYLHGIFASYNTTHTTTRTSASTYIIRSMIENWDQNKLVSIGNNNWTKWNSILTKRITEARNDSSVPCAVCGKRPGSKRFLKLLFLKFGCFILIFQSKNQDIRRLSLPVCDSTSVVYPRMTSNTIEQLNLIKFQISRTLKMLIRQELIILGHATNTTYCRCKIGTGHNYKETWKRSEVGWREVVYQFEC